MGVFQISTFSKMLKRLVEENGDSVSRLSQITGIDRTTLSKYISGSRLPSEEALKKLLAVIKPTEEERKQVLSQFELESSGELLYDQRQSVKEMLERLSLTSQYTATAKLPPRKRSMRCAGGRRWNPPLSCWLHQKKPSVRL